MCSPSADRKTVENISTPSDEELSTVIADEWSQVSFDGDKTKWTLKVGGDIQNGSFHNMHSPSLLHKVLGSVRTVIRVVQNALPEKAIIILPRLSMCARVKRVLEKSQI